MATKIQINKVSNCNIYMDGANLLGVAEEVDLPDVKHTFAEHNVLGMIGVAEFWSGIEKMEMRIKWKSYDERVLFKNADPFTPVKLMVKFSKELYGAQGREDEVPCTCFISAAYKDFPGGKFKPKDITTLETNLAIYYMRLEVDGIVVLEVDITSNIMTIDGDDLLANYRANLGI
jgi:uncharacterized protein